MLPQERKQTRALAFLLSASSIGIRDHLVPDTSLCPFSIPQKAHEALLSAVTSLPSSAFDKLIKLSASGSLSDAFADPAVAPLAGLVGRITNVAVSDLNVPPDEVSLLRHLQESKAHPAAIGAILEQQVTSLESVSPSPEAAATCTKLIEDALEVYEPDEFPVRRVRCVLSSPDPSRAVSLISRFLSSAGSSPGQSSSRASSRPLAPRDTSRSNARSSRSANAK